MHIYPNYSKEFAVSISQKQAIEECQNDIQACEDDEKCLEALIIGWVKKAKKNIHRINC